MRALHQWTGRMIKRFAVCCIVMLAVAAASAAEPTAPRKGVKTISKKAHKPAPRAVRVKSVKASGSHPKAIHVKRTHAAPIHAKAMHTSFQPAPALTGPTETLTCRDGTEDRHARIGVVLRGGAVDSFAYYSKWKPRTCSIYLRRTGDT